jgi:hypothetical protein
MGRQGPGAQALDPQAAARQQAAHPLANHPFAVHGHTVYGLLTIGGCPVQAPLGRDTRTTLYSLLATAYSLLPTPYSLLTIGGCPVQAPLGRDTRTTPHSLLPTGYSLLPTPCTSHPRVKGTGFSPYIRLSHFSERNPRGEAAPEGSRGPQALDKGLEAVGFSRGLFNNALQFILASARGPELCPRVLKGK